MRTLLVNVLLLLSAWCYAHGDDPKNPPKPPGFSVKTNRLTVCKENYHLIIKDQSPDSAVIVVLKAFSMHGSDDRPDSNAALINRMMAQQNLKSILCFYKKDNRIVRFTEADAQRRVQKEAALLTVQDTLIQCRKFDNTGQEVSQSFYKYFDSLNLSEQGRDVTMPRRLLPWYRTNAVWTRHGSDIRYHSNGRIRMEMLYKYGKRVDGDYLEWDESGKEIAKVTIRFGEVAWVNRVQKIEYTQRRAFLFGQDIFQSPDTSKTGIYPNLEGCMRDVLRLQQLLQRARNFPPESVIVVGGEHATKKYVIEAFAKFLQKTVKGDHVFLHFSGHGAQVIGKDNKPVYLIPCRDVWKFDGEHLQEGSITQEELLGFVKALQQKVGRRGQVALSLDACHAGMFGDEASTKESPQKGEISTRGETGNYLLELLQPDEAPVVILAATTGSEFSMLTKDENGEDVGLYSLALSYALADPMINDFTSLFESVCESIQSRQRRQTPVLYCRQNLPLFETSQSTDGKVAGLPPLRANGNAFSLSVGISQYAQSQGRRLSFENAATDAASYNQYFEAKFREFTGVDSSKRMRHVLLQNQQATKDEIICYINDAISNTKSEDYFVFNFSGYCRQLMDSNGIKQTWFVPYGLNNINSEEEIRRSGISLKQLKDLLQLVPANNQLFITEAGATADFQREFIQALIETSPTIAALSNKNRVFLVPKSSGADNCPCGGVQYPSGPLNHYITSLPSELNIYGLFTDSLYADALRFALTKAEVDCGYFKTGYFDIFFEREFLRQMKSFLPEEVMQSRGIGVVEQEQKVLATAIKRRIALVVGTGKYLPNTPWKDLANPVPDAQAVAASLARNFGFDTLVLINQPADSLYHRILWLAQNLQPNDQLLIYVGGHGDFDERLFDDGFIVTTDSRSVASDPYRNSYIQYSKLSRMINKLPPTQILTVLDVCFGGTFDERVARNKNRNATYDDMSNATFLKEKLQKRTRLYITSGSKNEVPDGYAGRHSPFAVRLLEAFETRGGRERMLTASALFQYVQKLPSKPMLGSFGDDDVGSEFILLGK
jgi:uncharacterized caspase-like protein